jgi:hypothetical protein
MESPPVTQTFTANYTHLESKSPSQSESRTTQSFSSEKTDATLNPEPEVSPLTCYLCLNRQTLLCRSCLGNWGYWTPCTNNCSLGYVRGGYWELPCQVCLPSPRPGYLPIVTCSVKGCQWGFVKCLHICFNCKGRRLIRCSKCDGDFVKCPTCRWASRKDASGKVVVWPQRCKLCIQMNHTGGVKPSECVDCSPLQGYIRCPGCMLDGN